MNVDLFSGIGGWDHYISMLGFERDEWACKTRAAAGLLTKSVDLETIEPIPCEILTASPPCQGFSIAGKQNKNDPRNWLVEETMLWVQRSRPLIVAFEQVPPVLPIWEWYASQMRDWGYSVWTGILCAEQYGVPQTRRRAILMASREKSVAPPKPTHSRYYPRDPSRLDADVAPWISIAEALDWGFDERPSPTVSGGGATTGGAEPFANAARSAALIRTRGNRKTSGGNVFGASAPSWALTEKARSWTVGRPAPTLVTSPRSDEGIVVGRQLPIGQERNVAHGGWSLRNNTQPRSTTRPVDEPAGTIFFGERSNDMSWLLQTNRSQNEDGSRQERSNEFPAPTFTAEAGRQWVLRSAQSVDGGPRAERDSIEPSVTVSTNFDRAQKDGVRITLQEALVLQGFPHDYPVQGVKSRQFLQVGNAIPPPLANAILGALCA